MDAPWLLLVHQLPPKPAYARVKVWRRLQALGAVAIKSTVYAYPSTAPHQEALRWLLREIVDSGGEAYLVEARFVEGLTDEAVKEMFRADRDRGYQDIAERAQKLE